MSQFTKRYASWGPSCPDSLPFAHLVYSLNRHLLSIGSCEIFNQKNSYSASFAFKISSKLWWLVLPRLWGDWGICSTLLHTRPEPIFLFKSWSDDSPLSSSGDVNKSSNLFSNFLFFAARLAFTGELPWAYASGFLKTYQKTSLIKNDLLHLGRGRGLSLELHFLD